MSDVNTNRAPVRLYAFHYEGHPIHASGRSRAAARYQAYLQIADIDADLTFAGFCRAVRSRVVHQPPEDDGYGYIRRHYGVDVRFGQRVALTGEGPLDGLRGTVAWPGGNSCHVVVDPEANTHGQRSRLHVHPQGIVPMGDED